MSTSPPAEGPRPADGPSTPAVGQMLLVSGPSGTGKSTICKLLGEDPRVQFSISATTPA